MGASLQTFTFLTADVKKVVLERVERDEKAVFLSDNPYQGLTNGSFIPSKDGIVPLEDMKEIKKRWKDFGITPASKRKALFEKGTALYSIFMLEEDLKKREKMQGKIEEIFDACEEVFVKTPKYEWKIFEVLPIGMFHFDMKWEKRESVRSSEYVLFSEGEMLKRGKIKELKDYALKKGLTSGEIRTYSVSAATVWSLQKKGVFRDFGKPPAKKYAHSKTISYYHAGLWCAE